MKTNQEFSVALKEARAKTGLKQLALAKILGVPSRTYESWEMGERTPQPLLQSLLLEKLDRLQQTNSVCICPHCGKRIDMPDCNDSHN